MQTHMYNNTRTQIKCIGVTLARIYTYTKKCSLSKLKRHLHV